MKLGLLYVNVGPFAAPEPFAQLVRVAEQEGVESIWTVDHAAIPATMRSAYPYTLDGELPLPPTTDLADPLIALGYAAALTQRIRLATGVLLVSQRHPAHVAKAMATLDQLSEGRAMLGVGIGWLKEEFELMGIEFKERVRRTEESVRAVRSLWGQGTSRFEGDYFHWEPMHAYPKPREQAGRSIPVVFGGCVEASARRAARLGDGFFPVDGRFSELGKLLDALRDECRILGRDPREIEVSTVPVSLDEGALRTYREMGVDRLIIAPPAFDRDGLVAGLREAVDRVSGDA